MTGRELLTELEKSNLLDRELFLLIDVEVDCFIEWDTHEVTGISIIDNDVYLRHEFFK